MVRMKQITRQEQGQSMVVIALILSVLMGFLAVAIDGGNNFLQRRRMQNAADGAAVAGAVEMATGTSNELAVCSVIRQYAVTRGGADSDQVTMYYTPRDELIQCQNQAIPDWANGVHVVVGHQFPSFVARIIGRSSFNVVADATAQFGAASSVVGVSPLAVADFGFQQGRTYTFWGIDCSQHGGHHMGYHDDAYQDTHHGGHDDSDCSLERGNITGANFALLDPGCEFPQTCNTSDADLKAWMRDGDRAHSVFENTRLQGDPGGQYGWEEEHRVPQRAVQDILGEARVGQVLIVPVYDIAYRYTTDQICNDNPGNPQYDPGPRAGQCHNNPAYGQCDGCNSDYSTIIDTYTDNGAYNDKYYYHIVSFAAFEVSEVNNHGDDKYIRGKFVRYVAPQGEMGGSQDNGVIIIKLTQ